jgi:uncharacterized membrane protein YphA (DoxX/SURF4 family)
MAIGGIFIIPNLAFSHGFDKIQNVDGFSANVVAKFFGFLPSPPQFWTYCAAATQIAEAGLVGLGVLSRPVAASVSAMIVAVSFHLLLNAYRHGRGKLRSSLPQ